MLIESQKLAPNQYSNDLLHYNDACTEPRLTIRNIFMFCFCKERSDLELD